MKKSKLFLVLAAGLGCVFGASAYAAEAGSFASTFPGLSANLRAGSAYTYRGMAVSDKDPSIGLGLRYQHRSGVFAALDTDSIKLPADDEMVHGNQHQALTDLSAGYQMGLANGVTVEGGIKKTFFTGENSVSDLSFAEIYGQADWQGASARLSYGIESADAGVPYAQHGNVYGELGYVHAFGSRSQYTVGGKLGYMWYADHGDFDGVKDRLANASVQVGYAYDSHLSVGLTHQFAGKNAYGDEASGTHFTSVFANYRF